MPARARPLSTVQRLLPVLGWLPTYRRDWLLPDVLAGLAIWAVMEGDSVIGRLRIEECRNLPQGLDTLLLDFRRSAAGELRLKVIAGRAAAYGGVEIADHGFDKRISPRIDLGFRERLRARDALLEQTTRPSAIAIAPPGVAASFAIPFSAHCLASSSRRIWAKFAAPKKHESMNASGARLLITADSS
jgi:hypothetical protein